jgi:hypothetical protein
MSSLFGVIFLNDKKWGTCIKSLNDHHQSIPFFAQYSIDTQDHFSYTSALQNEDNLI